MRKNYKWCKILISAVLCPALVLGMAACGTNNGNTVSGTSTIGDAGAEQNGPAGEKAEEVVFRPPVDTPFVTPGEKDESVYVKADASGRPTEKTVEVVLKKIEGADPIEDRSNLREIKNTEGNEEYSEAGEGRYLWQNNGEDIHYKGKSDEELPVNVRITYYLEGQEVSAEQIAGKTGKVKIRFDYENSTNVPFMVLSATMLPADVFSDVEVTNGRLMDLGDQKAVIGFAFPGLMDTLKLVDYEPTEEIELPEYVEIEARAEDFALDFTASVVSTGLFEDLEDKDLEDLDKLPDDMDELTDASTEIRDAAQIVEPAVPALEALSPEKMEEIAQITANMEQSLAVIGAYAEGMSSLAGSLTELSSALTQLKAGVSQLSGGSAKLSEGLGVFEKALSTASEGSAQLASAMKTVSSAGGELGSAYWQLVDGMNEFADGIAEFDEEGIQSLAELAGPEYKAVIRGVRAARDAEHS